MWGVKRCRGATTVKFFNIEMLVCLVYFVPVLKEYFTHMETSPIAITGEELQIFYLCSAQDRIARLSPTGLWSYSSIMSDYLTVGISICIIVCEGLQIFTYAWHSWPLNSEGPLACYMYTYCDTGHLLIMVISENLWHSRLLLSIWQWSCHYLKNFWKILHFQYHFICNMIKRTNINIFKRKSIVLYNQQFHTKRHIHFRKLHCT